jgi:hypothetical protein
LGRRIYSVHRVYFQDMPFLIDALYSAGLQRFKARTRLYSRRARSIVTAGCLPVFRKVAFVPPPTRHKGANAVNVRISQLLLRRASPREKEHLCQPSVENRRDGGPQLRNDPQQLKYKSTADNKGKKNYECFSVLYQLPRID